MRSVRILGVGEDFLLEYFQFVGSDMDELF